MTHGREKSDPAAVVAVKRTNKTERFVAESVEPRTGTKGNANRRSTHRAQNRASVSQAAERIRKTATALRCQTPKVGAVCSNWARTELCEGRSAMSVPTAIRNSKDLMMSPDILRGQQCPVGT